MEHPINEQIRKQVEDIEKIKEELAFLKERYPRRSFEGYSELFVFNGVSKGDIPAPHSRPVYILNKELQIIARVEEIHLVGPWISKKKYWFKAPGRSTIYEYIKRKLLYKEQLYFVEVSKYEEFMKYKKFSFFKNNCPGR
ncbi:hypothetical protein [Ureibacillus aquaedulcis]|uniref:Uncharacterized protein n=1 Tax=Ureibacillus aquaedulcis TaxID=3058421 RepID=A0ABT8GQY4_9BACL|nr:hypothetical protein [Ureibacillus sp. BA0131]MDN4493361.1 hypothetical protein [Ureibacillus sp. BA0131]